MTCAAGLIEAQPERQLTGRFITFEGIDGAGKSTHIEAVAQRLRDAGATLVCTREPGGTALAERLREVILHATMDGLTEALLVFAARRDHLQAVILPALARGDTVLCDRFTDATFAYQGGGRGFNPDVLATLEAWVQGTDLPGHQLGTSPLQPNLTVWFDLPPEEAAKRLTGARIPDKFEAQPLEFFRRVARAYADRLQGDPQRFARIDAAQTRQGVWEAVLGVIRQKGWLA